MSSLIYFLASPAHALDCAGLEPDVCEAANAVADQINAVTGELFVHDGHPHGARRPLYIYQRFLQTRDQAEYECGPLGFTIQGTIGGHFDRTMYGSRRWRAEWGDLDGTYGGEIFDGRWYADRFIGTFEGDYEHRMGPYFAWFSGPEMWMERDEGYGGGIRRWVGSGVGYIANLYGSCNEAAPEVVSDQYEMVGNTPLIAGMPGWGPGDLVVQHGLFDNDPDGDQLMVVGVTDGTTVCADTTPPFDCTTAAGGLLLVEADGSFAHLPPTGAAQNAGDGFEVLVQHVDGGGIATSTVELGQVARIWYVDEYGTGLGGSYDPAGTLDELTGQVEDGDVVVVGGSVPAVQPLFVSGDVRIQGGDLPVELDLTINGEPGPHVIDPSYDQGEVMAFGGPAIVFDNTPMPGALTLRNLGMRGDSGTAGLVTIGGPQPYQVDARELQIDATGTAFQVIQPDAAYNGGTSSLSVAQSFVHGATAFDLQHGGDADVQVDLYQFETPPAASLFRVVSTEQAQLSIGIQEAQLFVEQGGFDMNLGDESSTQLFLQYVELYASGGDALFANTTGQASLGLTIDGAALTTPTDLFAFDIYEGSSVFADLQGVYADAGAHALRVLNVSDAQPGFGAYVWNAELAGGLASSSPAIDLFGMYESDTRLAMGGAMLYHDGTSGPSAIQARGDHFSHTSVVLYQNELMSAGNGADVTVRTEHHGSHVCLEMEQNDLDYGTLHLRQAGGSAFEVAGFYGNGSSPWAVENHLRNVNLRTDVEVEPQGNGTQVDYFGTSNCMLP